MDWRDRYRHVSWLKPVIEDERVAARLRELDAETDAARDQVRRRLAE